MALTVLVVNIIFIVFIDLVVSAIGTSNGTGQAVFVLR